MCQALFSAGGFQSVVPEPASSALPRNVSEKQTLRLHLRLMESETLWAQGLAVGFSKSSMVGSDAHSSQRIAPSIFPVLSHLFLLTAHGKGFLNTISADTVTEARRREVIQDHIAGKR